ncbi:hypothetical protein [Streptacidiphilus sp. P02-A3a]|uniref:hypothetical protein n=1 Tax=Streptacidiphilus sp. P02-A3a TaxID=2704468 RepID=UPI001CDBFBA1|nr:hypothetical protein [Streptacidiphilus sp. P02-A3a]
MIPQEYREFFTAAAGASGALIGLLFVAITVSPERARHEETRVQFRIRASAALLVFSNALTLSLAALVPDVNLGWWCLVSSLGMLAFAFATTRSWFEENRRSPGAWRPLGLVTGLLLIVGFEAWAGVRLVRDESDLDAIRVLDYVVITDLLMGIARAWQLASMRETGLLTSLRVLASGEEPAAPGVPSAAPAPEAPQPPAEPPTDGTRD